MRGLKIPIALGVFVAVVLIGVAARSVYYKNQVLDPMTHQASEISGVEGVRVSEAFDGRKDVYVQFGPKAPIEEAFPKVAGLARATFGASLGRVIPEDRRSTELEQVYHDIHFHVHEGISTGMFSQMASDVARELADSGIDRHRVFVGDHFVFVQLYDGEHYLFEVVPRSVDAAHAAQGGIALW